MPGSLNPGCNCGCDQICISMRTYRFLCCEQRTYIFVKSECDIDEIRINGEVLATPGITTFGGLPSTAPVINIDGSPVTGVLISESRCGSCPVTSEQESETPYAISTLPVNCRYDVQVDSCGKTYYCSLRFCLPRVLTIYDMTFTGYTHHMECVDEGYDPYHSPETATTTYDFSITSFSFDDLGIDFCTPMEEPTIITGDSVTINQSIVRTGAYGYTATVEWVGTLSLMVRSHEQCDQLDAVYLLFTGTVTSYSSFGGPGGGPLTSVVDVVDFVLGIGVYGVCEVHEVDPRFGFILSIGLGNLSLAAVEYEFGDLFICQFSSTEAIALGSYTWCG